jgi:hypothetical protein
MRHPLLLKLADFFVPNCICRLNIFKEPMNTELHLVHESVRPNFLILKSTFKLNSSWIKYSFLSQLEFLHLVHFLKVFEGVLYCFRVVLIWHYTYEETVFPVIFGCLLRFIDFFIRRLDGFLGSLDVGYEVYKMLPF